MVEAKQLSMWGIFSVSGLMFASILMLGLLAIFRDGEVTGAIVTQLTGVIGWGLPVLGVLIVGGQTAAAVITVKTNNPTQNIPSATDVGIGTAPAGTPAQSGV